MNGRIITLGEIMLRLKPPGFERFLQSPTLEATFGGGEANVALSLAQFGLDVAYVSALPQNPIAEACIRFLNSYGVDTSLIQRQGERMGIYFLEAGANQRPSGVVYDRAHSAMATARPEDFDWDGIFDGASWFHMSGITPALSQNGADLTLTAVKTAKTKGIPISCDNNYRKKLWRYGKTSLEVMSQLGQYVDVLIANEEDCRYSFGVGLDEKSSELEETQRYKTLAQKVFATYPNLKIHAMTLRQGYSASHNGWGACLYNGQAFIASPRYDITHIVDRVGAGDAFVAGLIYGLVTKMSHEETLHFAVAASCLKHSIPGDVNLSTVEEVRQLMVGDVSGRVQR